MKTKTIKLKYNEFWPVLNILNEVCHGIYIDNFEKKIGSNKKGVVDFLDRISKEEAEKEVSLKLNDFEIKLLKNSFKEVFKQIEEWEFQTRIGITVKEATKIKEKFSSILNRKM